MMNRIWHVLMVVNITLKESAVIYSHARVESTCLLKSAIIDSSIIKCCQNYLLSTDWIKIKITPELYIVCFVSHVNFHVKKHTYFFSSVMQNHYELLGLKRDSTPEEIRESFIRLSKEVFNDNN